MPAMRAHSARVHSPMLLPKVGLGGSLHALVLAAIVDHVEVGFQNLLLGVFLLQVEGGENLPDLAENGVVVCAR